MTPPISPGHSDDGAGTAGTMAVDQELQPGELPSQEIQKPPSSQVAQSPWQTLTPQGHPPLTPPRRPARLLEDEQVHVEKPGVLKLTDFEVRGALGKFVSKTIFPFSHLLFL
jgi:hypothetical protein